MGSELLEAPDVNIVRVPQGGRTFECFSEDPWLTSRLAERGDSNCENGPLLTGTLKQEWGFRGFVMSDFGAVHSASASILNSLDREIAHVQVLLGSVGASC